MTRINTISRLLTGVALAALVAGCNLTPELKVPDVSMTERFKEDTAKTQWAAADQNAGQVDTSDWWTVFNDTTLNGLQEQATSGNLDLQIAAARLNQTDALYRQANANLLPTINLGGNAGRGNFPQGGKPNSNFLVQANMAYEVDMFGRIRSQAAIARLNKEAQADLLNQATLLMHAQVAQTYFALLALDTERDLLQQTIKLRQDAQKLIKSRYENGETGEQDYLRAQAELASTEADLTALDRQRAITEHALAVLLGKAPAELIVANKKLPENLPLIPADIPAAVLQRRPDIAAAQKQLAAANAQIGVARAAFFPVLNLTAAGGLSSRELGDVFEWSSRSWMLGPLFGTALSLPIFDGGRRIAGLDLAKAGYEERVAQYRQSVLVAFQDTEDGLSSLRLGAQQAEQLYRMADAATKANHLADVRYKEGETSYLDVLDTQRDALSAQRAYTRVQGQRFVDTVSLIRAMGGGWPKGLPVSTPATIEPEAVTVTETQPAIAPVVAPVPQAPEPQLPAAVNGERTVITPVIENKVPPAPETEPAPVNEPAKTVEPIRDPIFDMVTGTGSDAP